jgi:hypothetical protein
MEIACTAKLLKELGTQPGKLEAPKAAGIELWYADLFYFRGRKCVVLRNPKTGLLGFYLCIRRDQIRKMPETWPERLAQIIQLGGYLEDLSLVERIPLGPCSIHKTADRSSLASINQIKFIIGWAIERLGPEPSDASAIGLAIRQNAGPLGPQYSFPNENVRLLAAGKNWPTE